MLQISPLASVHPDAQLASDVTIDAFAVIEKDVHIGQGSWIASHATVLNGTRMGKCCQVFHGAVVGGIPQDLKFEGEDSQLIIGDHVVIREYATLNRGTKAYGKTEIGDHSLIMAYAHVAHDCIIGEHVILVNSVSLAGHVVIGDWSILGGLSAVHQFVHIGEHVMVGGGSMVRQDIPPFITVARTPLAFDGVNSIGLKRRGFSHERIERIQSTYRLLYQSGLNVTQARKAMKDNKDPDSEAILDFIAKSERGILLKS
ncbi:MAG: acyl-ACP--UDP-N-acetylglucosamine O-acyltransferase [Flavobacteriales bacterium]|jgi:UDP-N-acetylglucosamine acyltransferase|nr:acyl-ACP--UDP-N-acetylglucosamine O-acyltransferase [Schleiferiaceae bacterium]|tara:strand:- start:574 stop:1347 length:774 start_codon:yes stop_codon:yes gene_type:complete